MGREALSLGRALRRAAGGKAVANANLPAAGRALRGASARLAALEATGRAHEP